MLVYVCIVYGWCLFLHPLGRDYAMLEARGRGMPFLVDRLFAWEVEVFGGTTAGYHLVNLLLLYACMHCIYHFVNWTVKGPFWLGTLAAVLFMANPVHSEAVLNLCGVVDLVPCLFALVALTAYAAHTTRPRFWKWAVSLGLFALAVLPYRQNAFLILVFVLFEFLVVEEAYRLPVRLAPFAVIAVVQWSLNASMFNLHNLSFARMFAPLYFIFYPIGFLPETARAFCEKPWIGWVAGGVVVLLLCILYRKARRPAILFGLLAMAAARLFQGGHFIDPVHMVGGGQLLLANVLFNTALAGLFLRMMAHPKWRRPVIGFTTMLCLLFFGLQIREVLAWRYAGFEVKRFQAEVYAASREEPVAVMPDYQYFLTAPMCLSESIAHNTPFSKAATARPFLPLNYKKGMRVSVEGLREGRGIVHVEGATPLEVMPYPYTLTRQGAQEEEDGSAIELVEVRANSFRLQVGPL